MHGVCLAERAVRLGLHPLRVILLLLGQIVVSLLTLCTSQCDLNTHDCYLLILFLKMIRLHPI